MEVKARKLRGETMPRSGRETLGATFEDWWRLRATQLSKNTQDSYQAVWNAHVKGRFDHYRLSEWVANPQLFEELTADMRERGVGNAAQRRVLAVMSSVFTAAVRWNKIGVNPIRGAPKPPAPRQRHPHPMPPVVIERIRLQMLRRRTRDKGTARNQGDACLVTLMSYAGLRPGEALALTWEDVGQHTLAIDKAVSVGEEAPTKTRTIRTVPLSPQLAEDLNALRFVQGQPGDDRPLFPGAEGVLWSQWQFRNWRRRVWKPIVQGLAKGKPPQPRLATARPYDCRGSFVSLHLRAGESPLEVAAWAGHSPRVMFAHYAKVIDELVGESVIPVADRIARARAAVEEMERQDLDRLVDALLQFPTLTAAESARNRGESDPAIDFYREPEQDEPDDGTA